MRSGELAPERLSEIYTPGTDIREPAERSMWRVDTDGAPVVIRERYMMCMVSERFKGAGSRCFFVSLIYIIRIAECMSNHKEEWYRERLCYLPSLWSSGL